MDFVGLLELLSQDTLIVWAYALVFAGVFFEALPIIGVVIPGGSFAVLAAGVFTRLGYFSLSTIVLICLAATILIDSFGYAVGRKLKKRRFYWLADRLFIPRTAIDKLCGLIHGHTGKAIIVGRLNPPTRAIAPFMVGMERVPYYRFLFFSVISAVIWVGTFFFVGFLFGESLENIHSLDRALLWGVILLILAAYVIYLARSYYMKRNGERRRC